MKKIKSKSVAFIMTLVLMVGFSSNAFAYTYDEGFLSSSSVKAVGQLFTSNPSGSYPNAYATTESTVAIHTKIATVQVFYSNGTMAQSSNTAPQSTTKHATTQKLTADAETGVGFNGYHYANDANYGSWSGSTYVNY